MQLAEQAQAGIAGSHVIGSDSDAGDPTGRQVGTQAIDIVDRLALGQLKHDPIRIDASRVEADQELADAELLRLERERRDVNAQVLARHLQTRAGRHGVDAGQVDLDGAIRRFRREEQAHDIGEPGIGGGANQPFEPDRLSRAHVEDWLIHGVDRTGAGNFGHRGPELGGRTGVAGGAMALRIEDLHVGTAVSLGPVERRVRLAPQPRGVVAGGGKGRDAGRERERRQSRRDRVSVERAGQESLDDDVGCLGIGVRQEDRELVPSDPEPSVGGTDRHRDQPPQGTEELVPDRVPVLVVDLLQVVEVEQRQRQWVGVTVGVRDLARQLLLERPMVPEPRERIHQRVQSSLAVQALQLAAGAGEILDRPEREARHGRHREWQDEAEHCQANEHCRAEGLTATGRQIGGRGNGHRDREHHGQGCHEARASTAKVGHPARRGRIGCAIVQPHACSGAIEGPDVTRSGITE